MQRLNKPAHTPVGTALFLFLGLAILPASLKLAGVQISFSPRLSAAMDAWDQMAQVFGASSQPAGDLSVVRDVESAAPNSIQSSVNTLAGIACTRGFESCAGTSNELPNPLDKERRVARDSTPKARPRGALATNKVAPVGLNSIANHQRMIGMLGSTTLETMTLGNLLNSLDKRVRPNFEAFAQIRNLPLPISSKSLRVLVHTKRVAVSSKGAESKVFSALDATRRRECDRATLISFPVTSPDNSEF